MMPLEQRIEQMVSLCVGLSSGVDQGFLLEKLSHAEASKMRLEAQVLSLQHRLLELDHRLSKSKEEASMNAAAVRRQVVENVKLTEQLKKAKERCAWLEEECSLYLNDREVFRAVAEEAEDRTSQAEARALEAENKLLSEINRLERLEREHTTEVEQLALRTQNLESEKLLLEEKLSTAAEDMAREQGSSHDRCCKHATAKTCCNPTLHESTLACETVDGGETLRHEDNNKSTQQRVRTAESSSLDGQLMAEVQRLWREVALFKCNLAKAEIQIQILTDDNKELRAALRNTTEKPATPHHHQHSNTTATTNKNKIQRKSVADYLHLVKSDSSGGIDTPRHRQPLAPLLQHANYLR